MGSSNSYIRKKAALCAMRIVRRVPDFVDHFRERTLQLLSDKSHGVKSVSYTHLTLPTKA